MLLYPQKTKLLVLFNLLNMNIFFKKKLFAGFVLLGILFCTSYKGGITEASTGAPFEGTQGCQDCHSGGNYPVDIAISLKDKEGVAVSKFRGNTEYTLEVKLTGGNPSYYGFQMVPVDKDNKAAGTFGTLGTDVRKATYSGRSYIVQSAPRKDGIFTSKWTSPSNAVDSVIFYTSGLAANGNNGSNGDKGVSKKIVIQKDLTSGTNEVEKEEALLSNVISNTINFKTDVSNVKIYDLEGRSHAIGNSYEVDHLKNGIYILHYTQEEVARVKKVLVQN
jgi:hypothetical protein